MVSYFGWLYTFFLHGFHFTRRHSGGVSDGFFCEKMSWPRNGFNVLIPLKRCISTAAIAEVIIDIKVDTGRYLLTGTITFWN
jgi:hypothetical protein